MAWQIDLNPDVEIARAAALARIEAGAEEARARYRTAGAPYAEKLADATAWLRGEGTGPFLAAEIAATGLAADAAAARIVAAADAHTAALAAIEGARTRLRLEAKAATDAAHLVRLGRGAFDHL